MVLNPTWEFHKLKGDGDVIRAVEWSIKWTDPDFPGTEVLSSGVTAQGIELPVSTTTRAGVEAAVIAALGAQLGAIRAHAAETMSFKHKWDRLQVIDAPKIVSAVSSVV